MKNAMKQAIQSPSERATKRKRLCKANSIAKNSGSNGVTISTIDVISDFDGKKFSKRCSDYSVEELNDIAKSDFDFFEKKAKTAWEKYNPSHKKMKPFHLMLRDSNISLRSRLSNRKALLASSAAMMETYQEAIATAPGNVFFLTFIVPEGVTEQDNPNPNINGVRSKIYRAIKKLGGDAFISLQVETFSKKFSGEDFRRMDLHGHGLLFTDMSLSELKRAINELNARKAYRHSHGVRAIVAKEITPNTAAYLGSYTTRPPRYVKNIVHLKNDPKTFKLRGTTQGFTDEMSLKILYALHQIPIKDSVFSCGNHGRKIKDIWKEKYLANSSSRPLDHPSYDVDLSTRVLKRTILNINNH
ncbi:hypothetical protein [Sphingomonas sp. C3-2]|uniref:hypothetical protein n=1 Tax=Sphingomonas sp. C3-2 TaxID=3062169 RepID=UPI00294B786C|nr:hypothetical protein [Sphingomonas sp. C3-2]WOK37287.1 hypothetical protein QYC26_03615 [Sphingomonas sp. C3-2]